jgi:hypothetical protein
MQNLPICFTSKVFGIYEKIIHKCVVLFNAFARPGTNYFARYEGNNSYKNVASKVFGILTRRLMTNVHNYQSSVAIL